MQVKKPQLELDMEQTGSKSGKEYVKAYLTYMQSTQYPPQSVYPIRKLS